MVKLWDLLNDAAKLMMTYLADNSLAGKYLADNYSSVCLKWIFTGNWKGKTFQLAQQR